MSRIERALHEASKAHASKIALIDDAARVSYGELEERANALAAQLLDCGLVNGGRVALFMDKTVASVVALYAVWIAGGVVVPINGTLKSRQVEHILQHSDSGILVSNARKLRAIQTEVYAHVRVIDTDATERATASPTPRLGPDELAAILYTSGSTGRPKGIAIAHANLLAGVRIVAGYLDIVYDDVLISILPFSFDYGLNQLLTTVDRAATLVLERSPLPIDICRSLRDHRVTGMAAVPPLWIQLLQDTSPFSRFQFEGLRYITNSGGAMPAEVVRRYRELLPQTKIFLMYGLTEAFRSTFLDPTKVDRKIGSIGRAIPECDVFLVADDGSICNAGEGGELVHRGPTVSMGYWKDPAATAARFRPDPLGSPARVVFSGDLVRIDEEGDLFFVGRGDEMIKSLGYRISPGEVEETLFASGMLAEVVVKSAPDPVAGRVIVVHCVPKDAASFTTQSLVEFCQREMPSYMVPRVVTVHASFPRTSSGKVDRTALT